MGCSIDFRRKVLEINDRDRLSVEETANRFGISKSSVSRWAKRLEPCRTRNKPATKIAWSDSSVMWIRILMRISMNVRSGSDAASAAYARH